MVTVALTAQLILNPRAGAARTPQWSEPVRVSMHVPGKVDWFPRVAADSRNHVHVIWNLTNYDDNKGHDAPDPEAIGQLEYTRWNGETWTQQTDIGLIWYGAALRNTIAVDERDRIHVTYKGWGTERPRGNQPGQDIWYMSATAASADAVYAWSKPVQLSSGNLAYYSDLVVDRQGVIHVIWTEGDANGVYALYYAHSSDGGSTWSHRINLSGEKPTWWYRAHLTLDPFDHLHVIWEITPRDGSMASGLGFGITAEAMYAQSRDGGSTWETHEFPGQYPFGTTTPTPGPQQPTIGVDGQGTILLIYREFATNSILYRESADGRLWSAPHQLPGIKSGVARPFDVYDTATDSAGHVHVVMIGIADGSAEISVLHSEWNGHTWSPPEIISSGSPYPEYPRLAIAQGNKLHVVWFGGDNPSTNRTPVGIWYSTTTASSPHLESQSAALMSIQPSRGSNARVPVPSPEATPLPTTAAMPSTDALVTADRSMNPTLFEGLLTQPGLPIWIAILVSTLALAFVLFAQRKIRQG